MLDFYETSLFQLKYKIKSPYSTYMYVYKGLSKK